MGGRKVGGEGWRKQTGKTRRGNYGWDIMYEKRVKEKIQKYDCFIVFIISSK